MTPLDKYNNLNRACKTKAFYDTLTSLNIEYKKDRNKVCVALSDKFNISVAEAYSAYYVLLYSKW